MGLTLVQSNQAAFVSGTTLTVNFGSPTTAGNILVAAISQSSATDVVASVAQTGATFVGATRNTVSRPAEHWVAKGITGGQTGVLTTLTGSLFGFVIVTIMEFSWTGGSTSGWTFDSTTPANTGGTPVSGVCQLGTYSFPSAGVEALALASIRYNATYSSGPNNSWTRVSGADNRSEAGYLVIPSTSGTTTTAWTTANSTGVFGGQITSLHAPGGGSTAVIPIYNQQQIGAL